MAVIDFPMPGLDGAQVAAEVRRGGLPTRCCCGRRTTSSPSSRRPCGRAWWNYIGSRPISASQEPKSRTFTNDSGGHGMFVSAEEVQAF